MRSWKDLASEFRALCGSGLDVRLDHQDGAAGEHWRIAGGSSCQSEARFKALARMAGERVLEIPAAAEWPGVAEERDPVTRWYRALRQLPGVYRMDGYAIQKNGDGNDHGVITMATIQGLYESSATLCATLESLASTPRRHAELLCAVPRYAGPCRHWRTAQSILADEEPSFPRAVHEAISAVEGLCRIILGDPSITLGDALKRLKRDGLLHPALAKSIEGLWGFASAEPGVRHGAATPTAVKPYDAQYVVEACDAALVLLLALDGGS